MSVNTIATSRSYLSAKVSDYAMLTKFRLSVLVVFSAVVGYLFAVNGTVSWASVLWLTLGGALVTGASNALNQILERDIDRLMTRTSQRPLPANRMTVTEAILIAGALGVSGILLITIHFNALAGVLSALSLISYAFLYTPLKRVHPIAVFVGAIPGALPPMIGYVCAAGTIDFAAVLLFTIQFVWQFPHFWSIAWVQFDDYLKAGIMLLPSAEGRSKASAMQIVVYSALLLVISTLPYMLGMVGFWSNFAILLTGFCMFYLALKHHKNCDITTARAVMFGSFAYLPLTQLAMLFGKL
ncbi:MAG: heme o synthase [Chitinophagales bacterium]|nr:heme o synthase [Chitinophagales bacterium]MDW8418187.1 heme o synthase [Chitinophagales bacterium]